MNSAAYLKRDLLQEQYNEAYRCLESDREGDMCWEIEGDDGSVVWHTLPKPTSVSIPVDHQNMTDEHTAKPAGSVITASIPSRTQPPIVK